MQLGLHVDRAGMAAFAFVRKGIDLRGSWCHSTLMWPPRGKAACQRPTGGRKIMTDTTALDDIVTQGFKALIAPGSTQLKVLVDVG